MHSDKNMKQSLNLILVLIMIVLGLQLWHLWKQSQVLQNESYVSAASLGGTVWKFADNSLNVTLTMNSDNTASVKKLSTIPSVGTTEQRFFLTWESVNERDIVLTAIQPSSKNATSISWCSKTPKLYGTVQGNVLTIFTDVAKTVVDVSLSKQQSVKNNPIFRGSSERVKLADNTFREIDLSINPDGCGRMMMKNFNSSGTLSSETNTIVLVSVDSPIMGTISVMIEDCVDPSNMWSYELKDDSQQMTLKQTTDQVVYNLKSNCLKCVDTNCSIDKKLPNYARCAQRARMSDSLCKRQCDSTI